MPATAVEAVHRSAVRRPRSAWSDVFRFILAGWAVLHNGPWWRRWTLRLLLVPAVVFFTLFPYPHLLLQNAERIDSLKELTDPQNPALQPWKDKLAAAMPTDLAVERRPRFIQEFVYREVPYAFDWVVYGVADHWPTIADINASAVHFPDGRPHDDCDGRAVLAAALLRSQGIRPTFMADTQHVWLRTEYGEIMDPGRGERRRGPDGRLVHSISLADMAAATSFGIRVFPWDRQILWVQVTIAVVLNPRHARLAWAGPIIVAAGYVAVWLSAGQSAMLLAMWMGYACIVGGLLWCMSAPRLRRAFTRQRRRTEPADSAKFTAVPAVPAAVTA